MIRKLAAVLVLTAVPAMAAPSCLRMNNLYSGNEAGNHAVVLESITHRKFKVDYSGYCGNLKYVMSIGVKSQSTSDLSCLQRGDVLLTRTNDHRFSCVVQRVRPYRPKTQSP